MLVVRAQNPLGDTTSRMMQVVEVFFSVFGLMYAIIVGLLIVEAHRRWRELSSTVQAEFNAIGVVHDCLRYFDDDNEKAKHAIIDSFVDYVETMEGDWPLMQGAWTRKERLERFRDRGVTEIIEATTSLAPKGESDRYALGKIVDTIGELTKHRANRLELAEHGLPFAFFVLVGFMSFVIVGGVLLLDIDAAWLHGLVVSVIVVALFALFILLWDLDRPFGGYWAIRKESLDDIRRKLRSDAA